MTNDIKAIADGLSELLAKATPGPWQIVTDLPALAIKAANRSSVVQTPNQNAWNRYGPANTWDGVNGDHNAALIVAAVNALPALLDRITTLEAENASLREALAPLVSEDVTYLTGAGRDGDEAALFVTADEVRAARAALSTHPAEEAAE